MVSLAAPQFGAYSVVELARPSGTHRLPLRSMRMPLVESAGSQTVGGLFVLSFALNHSTLDPPNWATAIPEWRRVPAGAGFIQAGRTRLGLKDAGKTDAAPLGARSGVKPLRTFADGTTPAVGTLLRALRASRKQTKRQSSGSVRVKAERRTRTISFGGVKVFSGFSLLIDNVGSVR